MSREFQMETGKEVFTMITGEGTPRKLATATRPQFSRSVADFKQATGFQIMRHTLRKLIFD
jgi:hypothetical protein